MLNKIFSYLKNYDWVLFFSVLLLISFGIAEIYSVALSQDNINLLNFKKQIIFVVIGLILLLFFSFFDYFNFRDFGIYTFLAAVLILSAVLFFGSTVRGTKGWFSLGPFNIQPVEFVKILLIIFLAKYFSGASIKLRPLKYIIVSGFASFTLIFLVLMQPDFGSALLLFALWGILIYVAGFKKRYLFIIFLLIIIIFSSGWLFFFKDYQKERIMTFLNPQTDALNQGYNVAQAMIAVGSGGMVGRGIGFGSQSQLKFLPESQTDFIFAVIAEELGFLGVMLVLFLFSVFYYRILANIKHIKSDFGIFILLGGAGLIFVEMFINIGMNIGILPVVGIALPFLSYGGSSIISNMIIVGIMQSVILRSK